MEGKGWDSNGLMRSYNAHKHFFLIKQQQRSCDMKLYNREKKRTGEQKQQISNIFYDK